MFESFTRAFIYASLATPLLVARSMFFPFISAKAIVFRTLIELGVLCYVLHLLLAKNRAALLTDLWKKLKQPLVIALAAFTALFIITAFTGVNPTQSFWSNFERGEGAFQILHYFLFFLLIIAAFPTRKLIERLLLTHIGVSILVCLYALGQLTTVADPANFFLAAGGRLSGTLGNPSYLACYALITLAFLAYFFMRTKILPWRIIIAGTALFETFILIKTGTRGAFFALIIGLLVALAVAIFISKNKKVRLISGSILAGIVVLGALFFTTSSAPFWQKVPVFGRVLDVQSVANGFQPRFWTWESAFSGFLERPVLGYGAENFAYSFDKYYNPKHFGRESFFDRTHNVALEHMITGGVLLLLAWVSIFFGYARAIKKHDKTMWLPVLVAVPVAYVVQGLFLFDVLAIYLALYLFFALALTPDHGKHEQHAHTGYNYRPLAIASGIGVGMIIFVSLFFTSIQPFNKNKALTAAILAENIDVVTAAKEYQQALETPSPVGQEETISMFTKFAMNTIDNIDQNPQYNSDPNAQKLMLALVDQANVLYTEYRHIMSGQKNDYLIGAMNIRAGISFANPQKPTVKYPDYLNRGKKIYEEAIAASPTRIEFYKVLLEAAKIEKDTKKEEQLLKQLKTLRPDLTWE